VGEGLTRSVTEPSGAKLRVTCILGPSDLALFVGQVGDVRIPRYVFARPCVDSDKACLEFARIVEELDVGALEAKPSDFLEQI